MRIVVCVKPVPLTARLDERTARIVRVGPTGLNPVDENAIETALQIRESAGGGEVILLALSTPDAAGALRPGLAMGADRAVVIAGPEFAGSDLLGTSLALATAAQMLAPDLLVFGSSSSDGNGAMLWSAVAERLSLPVVSRAVEAAVDLCRLTATRQLEYGLDVVEVELPAVLALSGEINVPRYPSFKDVIGAKKKVISVLTIGTGLELDPANVGSRGARTTVLSVDEPPRRSKGVVVHDEGNALEQLVTFLRARRLL